MSTTDAPAKQKRAKRAPRAKRSEQSTADDARSVVLTKHTFSLMALSPYRFPLDVERLAVNGARAGAFVFGFFALLFTYQYLESTVSNLIVEASRANQMSTALCAEGCVTETPEVGFSYSAVGENAMRIAIDVSGAESVLVYAYDTASDEYRKLGSAYREADHTWTFLWDTKEVPSGQYWIKAVVQNQYGLYDRSDSELVTIP